MWAALSNRCGNPVHELTNEFGEFHLEIKNSDDLELALRCDPAKPIVITLKDRWGTCLEVTNDGPMPESVFRFCQISLKANTEGGWVNVEEGTVSI